MNIIIKHGFCFKYPIKVLVIWLSKIYLIDLNLLFCVILLYDKIKVLGTVIVASCKPVRPGYVSEELRSYLREEILLWTLMLNLSKKVLFDRERR